MITLYIHATNSRNVDFRVSSLGTTGNIDLNIKQDGQEVSIFLSPETARTVIIELSRYLDNPSVEVASA